MSRLPQTCMSHQRRLPLRLRSSWGVLPVGAALGGVAAEIVGIRAVFALGALISRTLAPTFWLLISSSELEAA